MKINLPINEFKLKGNKIYINDLIVAYEEISEDTKEVLESLISKGAYGSALLTLNTFYNVKSFNESNYSHKDYLSYLSECNKLLKECVVEVHKAHNFRPLINLNGLEIMESKNNIARGKGDTLLIEDFRNIKSAAEGSSIKEEAEGTQTTAKVKNLKEEASTFDRESIESALKRGSVVTLSKKGYTPTSFILVNEKDICYNNKEISFGWNTHPTFKTCDELLDFFDKMSNDGYIVSVSLKESKKNLQEEAEGTQTTDIAGKKDQEVGKLRRPKKRKKLIVKEARGVPRNHGFKGFMMDDSGFYSRGNYVLIKEGSKIKAVNKKSLKEHSYIKNK